MRGSAPLKGSKGVAARTTLPYGTQPSRAKLLCTARSLRGRSCYALAQQPYAAPRPFVGAELLRSPCSSPSLRDELLPSPTLSPTDPVPRGLLTLCPGASSGPQGQ